MFYRKPRNKTYIYFISLLFRIHYIYNFYEIYLLQEKMKHFPKEYNTN